MIKGKSRQNAGGNRLYKQRDETAKKVKGNASRKTLQRAKNTFVRYIDQYSREEKQRA